LFPTLHSHVRSPVLKNMNVIISIVTSQRMDMDPHSTIDIMKKVRRKNFTSHLQSAFQEAQQEQWVFPEPKRQMASIIQDYFR